MSEPDADWATRHMAGISPSYPNGLSRITKSKLRRNPAAREWAKEKREELIATANGKVPNAVPSVLSSSTQSFISLSLKGIGGNKFLCLSIKAQPPVEGVNASTEPQYSDTMIYIV